MGYSKNPATLEAVRHLLKDVEQGIESTWKVPVGDEDFWAYKIREGLYIARLYPQRYPHLAEAARTLKVEYVAPGIIRAVRSKNTSEAVAVAIGAVTHGLDTDPRGNYTGRAAQLMGPQTAQSIMAQWFAVQPSNTPLYFPDAALPTDQLMELFKLASAQHLIFFESMGAITLQPKQLDLEGLHWTPEDLDDYADTLPVTEVEDEQ